MDSEDQRDKTGKVLVYKVLTASTLVIPFDPDNPNTVDATAGMVETEDGLVLPLKDCLETLCTSAVTFGIEYDELTGMGTQVQSGHVESTVVDLTVREKDDPLVKEIIDISNINPVEISRTIN